MYQRIPLLLALSLATAAMAGNTHNPFLDGGALPPDNGMMERPTQSRFTVCFGHSCRERRQLLTTREEWRRIAAIFDPPPRDGREERGRIRAAIALMERIVGPRTDTAHDRGGNLAGLAGDGRQMDCVDEATNSTTYLRIFAGEGLLRFHEVESVATRFAGWPHSSASIRERATDRRWAVDSWFHDNGEPPEIVPIGDWYLGWSPE